MINLVALPCLCVDVFDGTNEMHAGGEALNFAAHASRFEEINVSLIGAVGQDSYADCIMDSISGKKIDVSHIRVEKGKVTANNRTYLTPDGDRYYKEDSWAGDIVDKMILNQNELEVAKKSDIVFVHFWAGCFNQIIELKKNSNFKLAVDFVEYRDFEDMEKYAPYVLDDLEEHSMDKKIFSILSEKGKFAYKAALWQFEHSMNSNYGTTDAGMLCLSYMRILELEINEQIICKMRVHKDEIIQKYKEFLDSFTGEEKIKHEETWGFVISSIKKEEGLELGPIYAMLDKLRDKKFKKFNPDYEMAKILKSYLSKYLSDDGVKALDDGLLATMVQPKVRNKYRNPPAHTRYVRLEIALECREYVEKNLLLLNGYVLNP